MADKEHRGQRIRVVDIQSSRRRAIGIAVGTIVLFLIALGDGGLSAELEPHVGLVGASDRADRCNPAAVRSGSDRATADEEGRGDIGRDRRQVA